MPKSDWERANNRDAARRAGREQSVETKAHMDMLAQAQAYNERDEWAENKDVIDYLMPHLLQRTYLYAPIGKDVIEIDLRDSKALIPVMEEGRAKFPESDFFLNPYPRYPFFRVLDLLVGRGKHTNRGDKGLITIKADEFRKGVETFGVDFDEAAARAYYTNKKYTTQVSQPANESPPNISI